MDDDELMGLALEAAALVRALTSPNPWVGAALRTVDGRVFAGATEPPGGRHAERVALDAARAAGASTLGATVAVTLEPCSHTGRTPPCADALVEAGVSRVVVGVVDPDTRVDGSGLSRLRRAGIEVETGVRSDEIAEQLAPYLHHRRTGRPWVVLKMASTLDGRTAAPDGSSRWITGAEARADVHRLRAESDAVLVGAGTVRADDPELTVRSACGRSPRRVVLGSAPAEARVHPCFEWDGGIAELLEHLGAEDTVQLLVEGGARVAGSFLRGQFVQQVIVYLAPAIFGGDDAAPLVSGPAAPSIAALRRGRIASVMQVGSDIRIDFRPDAGEGD